MNNKGIIGAIIGDIVGSRFEFNNCLSTDFDLFATGCRVTDDSIMTVAIAEWLTTGCNLVNIMRKWGKVYPYIGYGGMFRRWLLSEEPQPAYNSYGNGAGMRVSPCGFYAKNLEEALDLAKQSAEVTHNHPEGIKGAQAIASSIYLALEGKTKSQIKDYVAKTFEYDLNRSCDKIRLTYSHKFDETCQGSCPEAIIAFLESKDYESAIRLAVSIGGDSDTIACMTGSIAAAYYGVPKDIINKVKPYLTKDIQQAIESFDVKCRNCSKIKRLCYWIKTIVKNR